ncbi:hypothetical protein BN7_4783 [Wickerhamomyces ciferrii]|uniref:Uncharacterized protein n=1 Tax=Wickerhamomyces ciferrii (strain ATCC 14091 / BCRC 22168 / CBS 111 / JCM 3599 / NBRC 0793 / NRRL Y-1031 F-60-10) TaxID=1206466 RepID=K0KT36_WICCF|nr:uncharacterized protein BN7_4783 [Wickerhamomyces ciferrii]CCH45202.1 hypothetical protein BN7_4783 [Wickerhamomyces ciferrii]
MLRLGIQRLSLSQQTPRSLNTSVRKLLASNYSTIISKPHGYQIAPIQPHSIIPSRLPPINKRSFSTSPLTNFTRPPRFQSRPPTTFSLIWHLIPDGLKMILAIMGTASFILFIAAPLIVIVLPPLAVGGYFAMKYWLKKRRGDMDSKWRNLLNTHLTYEGADFDQIQLKNFTLERLIDAFETNENGITEFFNDSKEQHHSFHSRFELTGIETIDQDFRISKMGIQETISVLSFGLKDKDSRMGRIATVILTLRPKQIRNLLDQGPLQQDAIIEIKPLFNAFGKSFILNTNSEFDSKHSPEIIDVRPHNTRRYK